MVPNGENSLRRRSSSRPSSKFLTYRLTPWKNKKVLTGGKKRPVSHPEYAHRVILLHINVWWRLKPRVPHLCDSINWSLKSKHSSSKFTITKQTLKEKSLIRNEQKFNKMESNLISGHAILFHLLKFALQLILTLSFLLCTANINLPSIQFFTIHVINSLQRETFIHWTQTVL